MTTQNEAATREQPVQVLAELPPQPEPPQADYVHSTPPRFYKDEWQHTHYWTRGSLLSYARTYARAALAAAPQPTDARATIRAEVERVYGSPQQAEVAPQQEPVAWRYRVGLAVYFHATRLDHYYSLDDGKSYIKGEPLYAAPQPDREAAYFRAGEEQGRRAAAQPVSAEVVEALRVARDHVYVRVVNLREAYKGYPQRYAAEEADLALVDAAIAAVEAAEDRK